MRKASGQFDWQDQAAKIEDLCVAMFLAAASLLGLQPKAPISNEAIEKISCAANAVSERLSFLIQLQHAAEGEPELGN